MARFHHVFHGYSNKTLRYPCINITTPISFKTAEKKRWSLPKIVFFWISKYSLAIHSFIASCNIWPVAIPEIFAQTQGSDYWQLIHYWVVGVRPRCEMIIQRNKCRAVRCFQSNFCALLSGNNTNIFWEGEARMTPRIHPLYPGNYIIIKLNPEFKVVSIYLSVPIGNSFLHFVGSQLYFYASSKQH